MMNKLGYVFSVFLLTAVLSACATGDPSDGEGSEGANGKNEVVIANRENITSIDPHDGGTSASNSVQDAMYDTLYEIGKDNEMHPALATDYEESDDGLNYTFKLRDDVEFQDGTKFDA